MSHISKIELEIQSLENLREACNQLGFQFMENQKTYKWYGRWVGDSPLPEGIKIEDLGKCDHAIRVPDCEYEIGIIRHDKNYTLLWDYWYRGGLEDKIGPNAGKLKQAYTIARVKKEASRKRYRIREKRMDNGIRLVLSV
jgi:hypothetical protein